MSEGDPARPTTESSLPVPKILRVKAARPEQTSRDEDMKNKIDRPPSFMSVATLARELDVSESTVNEMVRRGVLPPPLRLSSGCVRWNWNDVQLALNSLAPSAGGTTADPFMMGVHNATQA